ncbi:MAG: N-acetylmuramoyl-L-alanine amidase [Clostridia bacterium]|nr:N-acetylmuramoyl-L-alanine amidase [Clostridia bacterium]
MKRIIFKIILCCIFVSVFLCGCSREKVTVKNNPKTLTHTKKVADVAEKPVSSDSGNEKISSDAQLHAGQELLPDIVDEPAIELPEECNSSGESGLPAPELKSKVIVLDPGHGKSSQLMSDQEKAESGYTYVQGKGWGEWRHFKSGTMWQDCQGSGCSGRAPQNGSCWYPIGAGDRDTEPDLNYNNAINAKNHLEQMGYTVRLTRGQKDAPSITQRIKSCYPNGDISLEPDAAAFVCIHSNAGGGRGSCYISLSGLYDQGSIPSDYIEEGNTLGQYINESITQNTSMPKWGNGIYNGYPELVLFCKSPVTVAYMEIGFYDNATDLAILQNESDAIGKAIATGIDNYFRNK